ncbi:MAG: InlB B-repeat-containing protein, partial [Clostridia bacterium]|nr:InlB B-repeat-containing protein [Clostridia bacterium]
MKSIKRFVKKTLSLILCFAMVMTTVIFFEIGIPKSQAAVTTATSDLGDVLFYVPEAVYLRPHAQSWVTNTTSTFHFFIENDVVNGNNLKSTPTTTVSYPSIGNIRFQYDNARDGSVSLSYRWLSSDLSTTKSGNGIRLGSADIGVNQAVTLSKASGANYYQTTITAANSKSPDLVAGETGCVMEWTVKFHDNADNLDKAVTAYTYVYKPNVVPLATAGRMINDTGTDTYCQQISWLTGFHSVVSSPTENNRYSRYATSATTNSFGLMPFQTQADLQAINDNTAGAVGVKFSSPGTLDSGAMMNSYFASTNQSYAYFAANQENSNFNNARVNNWDRESATVSATPGADTTYSQSLHVFANCENGGGNSTNDYSVHMSITNTAVVGMCIDTSRYTNLSQVPNLGVGLLLTDSEGCSGGAWYVADYTDRSQSSNVLTGSGKASYFTDTGWSVWTDKGDTIAHEAEAVQSGSFTSAAKNCSLKYAGTWVRAINSTGSATSTQTYKIKTAAATDDEGDGHAIMTIMQLQATQYNKANLRNAVANAQKEFAYLGVYDNSYNSHYYNSTGKYQAVIDAYKTACHALTAVNTTITNPDTLATNLNNAITNLKADTAARKTGVAIQHNVGLLRNADGTYRVVELPNNSQNTTTYYLRDKVEFTPDTVDGYTFKGFVKVVEGVTITALTAGNKLSALPTYTSASNRVNYNATVDNFVASFTATTATSTSTAVAKFSDDGTTVTYEYAYDSNIEYVYFYEITNGEVIFGNEFDFDRYFWNDSSLIGCDQYSGLDIDYVNNSITMHTNSSATDAYTDFYTGSNQTGYMTLIPGRTYEFSFSYQNLSTSQAPIRVMSFFFADTTLSDFGSNVADHKVIAEASSTGTYTVNITVPTGSPYMTIRLGLNDSDSATAASKSVKFYDICVRDITDFSSPLKTDDVSKASPIYAEGEANAEVSSFPTLTRTGYTFAGWSTAKDTKGNGVAANKVTSTTVPASGNRTLYPIWTTSVTYDVDGGIYRKATDSTQTSYYVPNRSDLEPTTTIPTSNRVEQGATGWDDASVDYTYVPYKPGYNFKGWLASSTDASVNGNVYWPTDTVAVNANVEFTAQWEEAITVTLNTTSRIMSTNNDGERAFYPGQVHFFAYTPDSN